MKLTKHKGNKVTKFKYDQVLVQKDFNFLLCEIELKNGKIKKIKCFLENNLQYFKDKIELYLKDQKTKEPILLKIKNIFKKKKI